MTAITGQPIHPVSTTGAATARPSPLISPIAVALCLTGALWLPAEARCESKDAQASEAAATDPQPVVAAPVADPPKIEFLVSPYAMVPWIYTSVHPHNAMLPSASATVTPDKLIRHLTWVPFFGAAEVRSGRFGVFVDYIHAPLTAGLQAGAISLGGGTAGLNTDTGSVMIFYRAVRDPVQTLDIGVGMRAWGMAGDITVSRAPLALPDINVSNGFAFADPLIGARYRRTLGKGFAATAYGDIGGGAGADLQWQALAAINYKKPSWPEMYLGFRTLGFNYNTPNAHLSVNMFGPVFGTTLHF